jgi:hypothetical protein
VLPTVAMSMPWSSVHVDGGRTREIGVSGKTQSALAARSACSAAATAARIAAAVRRPTAPEGVSLLARWKAFTARTVPGPKTPFCGAS